MTRPTDEELIALLIEASADLTAYVDADYPPESCTKYPDIARRHHRDLELVRRIDASITALRAALAASLPADPVTNAGCRQQVKVKPLKWVWHPCGWIATSPTRQMYAIDARIKGGVIFGNWTIPAPQFDNVKTAKAAAEQDYNTRILSAIELAPVTLFDALRVAFQAPGEYLLEIMEAIDAATDGLKTEDEVRAAALRTIEGFES